MTSSNSVGTILVTGATGAQGGAVARSLLASGRRVRVLTRKPDAVDASALRRSGAEIVAGDLGDRASLSRAMTGCTAVFGLTNYWEHFDEEVAHGRSIVDVAREAGVEHLVLSTLPSSEGLSGGAIRVPHFESKAAVEAYARSSSVPTTFVHVAFYYENFLTFFPPTADEHGELSFAFPQGETPLAGVSVEDVGAVVAAVLRDARRFVGTTVGIVGDELRGDEYAAAIAHAIGQRVRYRHVPREIYAELPFPGAEDLARIFDLNRRFIPSRAMDRALTHALHPDVIGFADWAFANRERLSAAAQATS